ncbi:MAG: hypothetical protein PHU79_00440 [Oscillospiraceae bacterium]|nr:hypothetical protein [Oscillospiraceae bacterium]
MDFIAAGKQKRKQKHPCSSFARKKPPAIMKKQAQTKPQQKIFRKMCAFSEKEIDILVIPFFLPWWHQTFFLQKITDCTGQAPAQRIALIRSLAGKAKNHDQTGAAQYKKENRKFSLFLHAFFLLDKDHSCFSKFRDAKPEKHTQQRQLFFAFAPQDNRNGF